MIERTRGASKLDELLGVIAAAGIEGMDADRQDPDGADDVVWRRSMGVAGVDDRTAPPSVFAEQYSGIMVALTLPDNVRRQLEDVSYRVVHEIMGDEDNDTIRMEEMHVTVAYIKPDAGWTGDERESVAELVGVITEEFVGRRPALEARIAGFGRFMASPTSDGNDVVVALIDAPGLDSFRVELVRLLESVGVPVAHSHGYIPHCTVAYVPPDAQTSQIDAPTLRSPFVVDSVIVKSGDAAAIEYEFADDGIE